MRAKDMKVGVEYAVRKDGSLRIDRGGDGSPDGLSDASDGAVNMTMNKPLRLRFVEQRQVWVREYGVRSWGIHWKSIVALVFEIPEGAEFGTRYPDGADVVVLDGVRRTGPMRVRVGLTDEYDPRLVAVAAKSASYVLGTWAEYELALDRHRTMLKVREASLKRYEEERERARSLVERACDALGMRGYFLDDDRFVFALRAMLEDETRARVAAVLAEG